MMEMISMKIKEAMNPNIITINSNTTPLEAFQKMYKEGIRRLFVMDNDGKPQGVVSYTDLIGVLGSIKPSKENIPQNIAEIMSRNIMTISVDDTIKNAANLISSC